MLTSRDENMRKPDPVENRLSRVFRLDWLGQMIASALWVASVFSYGIGSTGDLLQLGAALAWMIANLAALINAPAKNDLYINQAERN